ncbi:hypothetical protein [Haliangium sp.]|uniref:hypothetical protein n=1 Tax=Haliangium sp. TaxID=2663208 RepID=UPI003D0F6D53
MLALPVIGVAVLVAICWLAGGTKDAVIVDADEARAQVLRDEPDFTCDRVLLAQDGRAALVADAGTGELAAVVSFGDKLVTRRLGPGALRSAGIEPVGEGRVLALVTYDHTCRRIEVALAPATAPEPGGAEDEVELDTWLAAAQRCVAAPATNLARIARGREI